MLKSSTLMQIMWLAWTSLSALLLRSVAMLQLILFVTSTLIGLKVLESQANSLRLIHKSYVCHICLWHCGKLEIFLSVQKHNCLTQLHALNAAPVNDRLNFFYNVQPKIEPFWVLWFLHQS